MTEAKLVKCPMGCLVLHEEVEVNGIKIIVCPKANQDQLKLILQRSHMTDSPICKEPEENPLFTKEDLDSIDYLIEELMSLDLDESSENTREATALLRGLFVRIIPKLKNLTVPKQTVKDSFGEKI